MTDEQRGARPFGEVVRDTLRARRAALSPELRPQQRRELAEREQAERREAAEQSSEEPPAA